MSEVFVLTDTRRACPGGVIGSTVGAYPRGTGSNPVGGNGHFFAHAVSSIFRVSLTHTHTRRHTHILKSIRPWGRLLPGYHTRFFLQRGCCCQGKEVVPVDHIRGNGLSSRLTSGSKIRLTAGFEPCPQGPAPSSFSCSTLSLLLCTLFCAFITCVRKRSFSSASFSQERRTGMFFHQPIPALGSVST